jgi:hypothetical protein
MSRTMRALWVRQFQQRGSTWINGAIWFSVLDAIVVPVTQSPIPGNRVRISSARIKEEWNRHTLGKM